MATRRWLGVAGVVAVLGSATAAHADSPGEGVLIVEVRDAVTLRPQAQASVSLGDQVRATDARGRAQFMVPAGRACASVSGDGGFGQACADVIAGRPTLVGVALAAGAPAEDGPAPPHAEAVRVDREDALWRTDHVAAALLDARIDPTRLVTVYDGVRRLPGAPAVPRRFLAEQAVVGASAGPDGAGDQTALEPRSGSNQFGERLRLQVGRDLAADAGWHGWLKRDRVWWSAAGAIDRTDATWRGGGQLRVDAGRPELLTSLTLLGLAGGDGEPTSQTASWRTAWQYNDGRSTLETGVSLDRVATMAGASARTAASLAWHRNLRALGWHRALVTASAGTGTATMVAHRDGSVAVRDAWSIWPELLLTAGVGVESRTWGPAQRTVWTPGATLAWDPTKEGRAMLAVSAARVALLDVGALGAWTTGPSVEDRAMARMAWSPSASVVLDARYIAARDDRADRWHGVDGRLAWRGRRGWLALTGASHTRALLGAGELTHNLGGGQQLVLLGRGGVRAGAAVWGSGIGLARKLGTYGLQLTAEVMGQGREVEARLVASLAR